MEIDLKLGCRARELFYYLKGGKVDYGEEHSRVFGHSQFGRLYEQGQLGFVLSSGFVLFLFFFFRPIIINYTLKFSIILMATKLI